MLDNTYIGRIAYSKSGRDEGKTFLIIGIINDDYVYISDGDLRPIEKPKKKKVKHLDITDIYLHEVASTITQGGNVSNKMVRKYIQSMNSSKEV